jgi:2-methylcitrate dehydratase PrpD
LTAFVVAYEAAARLTDTIDAKRWQFGTPGPTNRGWWHVGLIAPIAAALATCRLKRASIEQTASAIGIATASSAGFRASMGTMTKGLHSGNGARGGVEATLLAMRGFTGNPQIIEAPLGFVNAISMEGERDPTSIPDRLGRPYILEKSPGVKYFPAVTPAHGVIAAALQLAREGQFSIDDIEIVEADFSPFSLPFMEAHDEEQAGFCAPFLIACSLVRGAFGPDELTPETISDPRIVNLSKRVVRIEKVMSQDNTVRVKLRSGRSLSATGSERRMLDSVSIGQKFDECALKAIAPAAAEELRDTIMNLGHQLSITRLMALTRGA